jgi:hypothetical protein
MYPKISRRDFLKLGFLSLSSLAFSRYQIPSSSRSQALGLVRVTTKQMKIFNQPSYQSKLVGYRTRDQLLYIYDKIESVYGPDFNPYWYRVEGGYAHTAYLQPVETDLHPIQNNVPEEGRLFEVTIPLTQSMRYNKYTDWQPLYRLYYQSVHWVTGLEVGPNGKLWYKIKDDLLKIDYHVPAVHMRPISLEELTPISPDISPEAKSITVNIKEQSLKAYEGDKIVLETNVSTGIPGIGDPNGLPSHTPRGEFRIQAKLPVRHMGNGEMTSDIYAYELPGVPWVCFFTETGVAFHGTYWHDNYGNEMSHGCVNMRPEEAKWLYRWTTPISESYDWVTKGRGTRVTVI